MSVIDRPPMLPTGAGRRRGRVRQVLRWSLRLALVVVVVVLAVVAYTAIRIWQVGREDHRPHSDVILVLGAAEYDGTPSPTLAARLQHAALLYKEGVAAHVVTVGGKRPGDVYTEAGAGADYLEKLGVPAAAIVPVDQGTDTLLSLRAAAPDLRSRGWHSVVLVTDPWHELRSRTMTRDLGFSATTSPTHTGPASHGRLTEVHYIARETAGLLYYEVFHRP